jgi:O-antigen polymerase
MNVTALNKYISLTILAALLCTCCITNEVIFNGVGNAKSIWFICVIGIAMLYFAATSLKGQINIRLNNLDIAVSAFFIFLIANNLFHGGHIISHRNVENAGLLFLYFFTKRLFVGTRPPYRLYLILLLLLILSQITIAVLQWFEYLPSYNSNFIITGIFFNPGPFTIFLSAISIYGLCAGLYSSNKIIKIVGIVLFIAAIPIVLITLSRSAWLGLIAGVLFIFTVRFQLLQKASQWFKNTYIKTIGIFALLGIFAFSGFYLYHLKKDSADGRMLTWKISSHIIAHHPINGIGQDRFPARFIEYQSAYFKNHPDKMLTEGRVSSVIYYAFNDILQITVEQGVIGLTLFLAVLLSAFKFGKQLTNSNDKTQLKDGFLIGAMASIVVILISSLTAYPLVMLPISVLFYSASGIISAAYTNIALNSIVKKPLKSVLSGAMLIAGIGFIIYSLALVHAYYLANDILKNGYKTKPNNIHQLMQYKSLINTEEWYVLRHCSYLLHIGQYEKAIYEMEKAKEFTGLGVIYFSLADVHIYKKNYAKAEEQLKLMYYALPGLVTPKYRLAKFYYDTNQQDKWEITSAEVLNFKPKIESYLASEMIDEIRRLKYKY